MLSPRGIAEVCTVMNSLANPDSEGLGGRVRSVPAGRLAGRFRADGAAGRGAEDSRGHEPAIRAPDTGHA